MLCTVGSTTKKMTSSRSFNAAITTAGGRERFGVVTEEIRAFWLLSSGGATSALEDHVKDTRPECGAANVSRIGDHPAQSYAFVE